MDGTLEREDRGGADGGAEPGPGPGEAVSERSRRGQIRLSAGGTP